MANRFSNFAIKIEKTGPSANIMNGTQNLDIALNTTAIQPAGGNAFDDLHHVATQTPEISVTTESLKGVLDIAPNIQGLCLTGGPTITGITVHSQAHDACGAVPRIAASSSSAQMVEGRLVVETVNGSPGSNATISYRGHGASVTGAVEPIVFVHGSVALPTVDAALKNTMWVLGKVIVGGTTIDRIVSVTISYNLAIIKPITYGSIWPLEVHVTKTSPTISITTEDVSLVDPGLITSSGLAVTHANTSIQFRKRDGTGFVADVTAEHIKLTAAGIAFARQVYTAGGAATGTAVIGINTIDDGSLNPLVWNTAIAYVP